ncbi:MAG TPA: LysM peptidoglycan-binding domain-containing protein [Candidatus Acidoferrales bacterium]|nr:LysM peptidoglycan-binding domain-containing protein [Candidatus Acidoferrales bacterium]
MKCKATTSAVVIAAWICLAGCEETSTKQVRVQPPAPAPAPANTYAHQPLPFPEKPLDTSFEAYYPRPAIDVLVDQVQAALDAGRQAVEAKKIQLARTDFDHAVDLILKSGFPKDSDPRLAKLFDDIGDAVPSDDLIASETPSTEMDEESETPAQPAPIDEITELSLPAGDPRLAVKAEQELIVVPHDLPLNVNESVLQYLSFFTTTRGRAIVTHGLDRAGRYSDMIRRVLKEEGVPQDLIYLAQAESAFQPDAVSRAGARGIWQFMPFRGEEYDLERSYYVDERSDPEKATRAAARHLRDLYAMFGDWYLVMAAYNAGPIAVEKAIERTGYADFWELQRRRVLPKQTQNYVPIILALALVAKAPSLYGVQVDAQKPPQIDAIRLDHPIALRLVADATNADLDDLHELNPELLRNVTPSLSGFQLKLPAGAAKIFQENIQQVPEDKWTSWRLHSTEPGETLADIARRYRVTVPAIEAANHLEARATVPQGFLLNVPTPAPPAVHLVHYRVQRGDTLAGIADRFDVTVAQLRRWNRISGDHAPRGVRLRIYEGSGESAETTPHKTKSARSSADTNGLHNVSSQNLAEPKTLDYHVKAGETIYSIARENQTTVSAIREANTFLSDRPLEAGDVLKIQR